MYNVAFGSNLPQARQSHHPTEMVLDALARRTVFSTLGNVATNLVLEFHGGTMFGVPTAHLTPRVIAFLRRYRDLWEHFSHRHTYGGSSILFTIKFPFDTLQQKCTTLKHLRKHPGVKIDHAEVVIVKFQEIVLSCNPFRSEKEVHLKRANAARGRGVWKRVADLKDIEIEFG